MTPTLEQLIEAARSHVPTPEEREEHCLSFAYGNVMLSWENSSNAKRITFEEFKEMVRKGQITETGAS